MPNWFLITQPALVVAALAIAVGAQAVLRLQRTALALDVRQRRFAVGGAVGVVLLLASLLAIAGSAIANLLLIAATWIAGVRLAVELYRTRPASVSADAVTLCVLLRSLSLLCVLLLIAAPVWQWTDIEFEKPRLAVLLDQSQSMSIRDPLASMPTDAAVIPTRLEIANAAIRSAAPTIAKLGRFYDIQPLTFGQEVAFAADWKITATDSITALGAALRRAAAARNELGEAPALIVALTDGAENTADPLIVRQAADELAAQRIGLVAIGIGAPADQAATVAIDPLGIPARIGTRDRLRVPVAARVNGCNGLSVRVELQWDDLPRDGRSVRVDGSPARMRSEFDTTPPGPGLRRVTARVTLPRERGGESYERVAIVDVHDEAIRVAIVEPYPCSEAAFIRRALEADARFDVTQVFRPDDKSADPTAWETHDVLLLGDVGAARLAREETRAIALAVQHRGVGVMFMGGGEFFSDPRTAATDFDEISPVELGQPQAERNDPAHFQPTDAGLAHAILQLSAGAELPTPSAASRESIRVQLDASVWQRLSPLVDPAHFGKPRPLAQVLAGEPTHALLVAHEVGRGRTLAAAWQATWPWALESDEGMELHRRLWRQIAAWLANRRPTAWVITDQSTYQTSALISGQQTIRVRAGVSGEGSEGATPAYTARLTLRPHSTASAPTSEPARSGTSWSIPLARVGERWEATLPRAITSSNWIRGGEFELELVAEPHGGQSAAASDHARLTARTLITLQDVDLEFRSPTANLDLLADAAQTTTAYGGLYAPIGQLESTLEKLTEKDPRRRIERMRIYDPLSDWAWLLLSAAAASLCAEWWIRRSVAMR